MSQNYWKLCVKVCTRTMIIYINILKICGNQNLESKTNIYDHYLNDDKYLNKNNDSLIVIIGKNYHMLNHTNKYIPLIRIIQTILMFLLNIYIHIYIYIYIFLVITNYTAVMIIILLIKWSIILLNKITLISLTHIPLFSIRKLLSIYFIIPYPFKSNIHIFTTM